MSPLMLRSLPTPRTSPFRTLYICHQIGLWPISHNWPHSNRAPDLLWLPIDRAKHLYVLCENNSRDEITTIILFIFLIFTGQSTWEQKSNNAIWFCIINWCGMLAPEMNDKVEGALIQKTARAGRQRYVFSCSWSATFTLPECARI